MLTDKEYFKQAKLDFKKLQEKVSKYQTYTAFVKSFNQDNIRDYNDCADVDFKSLTATVSNRDNKPVLTTDVEIWDDKEAIFVGSYDINEI